jgi:hypothetical protein
MNGYGTADRRQRHVAALRALSAAAFGLRVRREEEEEREIHQISNSWGNQELGARSQKPGARSRAGAIETNAETQQNRRLASPCLPCLAGDMVWLQTGPGRLISCRAQWSARTRAGVRQTLTAAVVSHFERSRVRARWRRRGGDGQGLGRAEPSLVATGAALRR